MSSTTTTFSTIKTGKRAQWQARADKRRANAQPEPAPAIDVPVSHLTTDEIEDLRNQMLGIRGRLLKSIGALEIESSDRKPDPGDSMAGTDWQRSLDMSSVARKRSLLHVIDYALRRMEKGTYGFCEESNKPIPISRLREVPWARRL